MRFTALPAALVLLLPMAAGCGYDYTTPSPPPTPPPSPPTLEGLWTSSATPSAIIRLAPAQLGTSGGVDAATAVTTPSAQLFTLNSIAFDTDGTMWVASQAESLLLAFGPATLTSSGSSVASVVIAPTGHSLSEPTGLAFDPQHRLWVANSANGTLVRFDAAQLAGSGAPVPAVVLSGLGHLAALAFDAAGSLWVSDNLAHTVVKYAAAQLAASGSPAPAVVLSANAGSLMNPGGLAFDASGNLWVANAGNQTLTAFTPAQMAATGSPAPHAVLSSNAGTLFLAASLAFDADGSLWVMGLNGILDKFASSALVTGAPAPSVRLTMNGRILFWSVAFWPKPAGLPLN